MTWLHSIGLKACLALSLTALGMSSSIAQQAPNTPQAKTELLWLGQAGFRIKTPGGQTIVIDPWLTGGPKTPAPYKTDIAALGKVDLLLVTTPTSITSAMHQPWPSCTKPCCTGRLT